MDYFGHLADAVIQSELIELMFLSAGSMSAHRVVYSLQPHGQSQQKFGRTMQYFKSAHWFLFFSFGMG